jgi:hypothetical protein
MAWSEADVVGALARAGARGLSKADLAKHLSAAAGSTELAAALTRLKVRGAIRGPFRMGRFILYFEANSAPTREQLESRIEDLLRGAGTRVSTRSDLEKGIRGAPKLLFKDAVSALKGEGRIVELRNARRSPLYVHRDAIFDQLRLEDGAEDDRRAEPSARGPAPAPITLEDVRPAYLTLQAEQGGISAVKIYDIWKRLKVPQEELHAMLLREAQRGRVSLHAASTVNFPREVMDAGIKVEGESQPYVTVILRDES